MKMSFNTAFSTIALTTSDYFHRVSFLSFRQKILIFCISTLVASITAYSVLLHKTIAEGAGHKQLKELQLLELRLARDLEVTQREVEQLKREVGEYQIQLARIPPKYQVSATLAYLGALADSIALQIKRIKPQTSKAPNSTKSSKFARSAVRRIDEPVDAAQFLTQVFDLTLSGEYHQFLEFLRQLAQSSHVAEVEEMKITGDQTSPILKARFRLKFYFINNEVSDEVQTATSTRHSDENNASASMQKSRQLWW